MRYSQIERECLSATYACERNRLYLFGRPFTIINDNKSLVTILNNPKAKPPARIERMVLRLQEYTFNAEYVTSQDNISDYLSRHPGRMSIDLTNYIEEHVNFIATNASPIAITLEEIKIATGADPFLQKVIHYTNARSWYKLDQMLDTEDARSLKQYRKIKDTLTVNSEQRLILKDNRIVLPRCYQNLAIKLAHQGHRGLSKTKALLRRKIFFFGMGSLVAQKIDCCIP
ncbi:uncharacterized protein LOC130645992 [Hydractinia symbiolongicarpus]|uniref:uncharacterized protein LOC130645992 n=1 Tax=Hydractinia symbiolongicarpus TaxID=13093 RepID=UPI00254DBA63|nr:uncharacterized protein LOC130645992 [Hydractinia symbiolongicarpus]